MISFTLTSLSYIYEKRKKLNCKFYLIIYLLLILFIIIMLQ